MNKRIPLFQPAVQNVDEIQLKTFAASLVDGYIDEAEFINRRPGHVSAKNTGLLTQINSLYYWSEDDDTYYICGTVFGSLDNGTIGNIVENVSSSFNRVTWASVPIAGVNTVFFAVPGGNMYYYNSGAGLVNLSADTAAITWGTLQIDTLDSYLLSIASDGKMHFSNVLDPTSWDGDFLTAESTPDGLKAIKVVGDVIHLFGTRSIDRFYNDGSTPFAKYSGGRIDNGTFSPDTIQVINGTILFLDKNRRLTALTGGQQQQISAPFDKTIQSFRVSVDDAHADVILIGGKTFYLITFPSFERDEYDGSSATGVTFVFDFTLNRWYEWAQWDASLEQYDPYMAHCYAFDAESSKHYIGSRLGDGRIYEMRTEYYQDSVDGVDTPIRTKINSGYFDHGTLQKKQVNRFMCRLKKGKVTGLEGGVVVSVRYKDEFGDGFGNTITIDMSDAGDTEFFVKEGPLGQYRARQYEVISMSNKPFIMGSVEEDITLLEQ